MPVLDAIMQELAVDDHVAYIDGNHFAICRVVKFTPKKVSIMRIRYRSWGKPRPTAVEPHKIIKIPAESLVMYLLKNA
jgi:hypothetical protein